MMKLTNGEKFALLAMETRSDIDLVPTELAPGLWASSTPMIGLDAFWKDALGTIETDHFHACTLFLLVKGLSPGPASHELQNRVYHFYTGMLLADRFGTEQLPFLITGDCGPDGLNVRGLSRLDPARHAPTDRWQRIGNDHVRRGIKIGRTIESFPWVGSPRLNRVLSLYVEARGRLEWMDRIHQYTRCLDGLTIPPGGGTGKKFAQRMALIAGSAHRDWFEEIYRIRGAVEHLRDNDLTEPFHRAGRLDLVKKAGIVEYVVRVAILRILETKLLWQHFRTKDSLRAFWEMPVLDRETLWGAPIDPMGGIAGFDEAQFSDTELGKL